MNKDDTKSDGNTRIPSTWLDLQHLSPRSERLSEGYSLPCDETLKSDMWQTLKLAEHQSNPGNLLWNCRREIGLICIADRSPSLSSRLAQGTLIPLSCSFTHGLVGIYASSQEFRRYVHSGTTRPKMRAILLIIKIQFQENELCATTIQLSPTVDVP